jgi:ribosomal 30S subunit maturation factor RimM
MSPNGEITVEESSTGIVKVTLDPKLENGEFYQVKLMSHAVLRIVGHFGLISGLRNQAADCWLVQTSKDGLMDD